jgi:hypothetical protein
MARKFRNLICIDDRSARGHRDANMPTWNPTKALCRKLRSKSEPRETTGMRVGVRSFLSVELRGLAPRHALYRQCVDNRCRYLDNDDIAAREVSQNHRSLTE